MSCDLAFLDQFHQLLGGDAHAFGCCLQCARQCFTKLAAQLFRLHNTFAGHLRQCIQSICRFSAAFSGLSHSNSYSFKYLAGRFAFHSRTFGSGCKSQECFTYFCDIRAYAIGHLANEVELLTRQCRVLADGLQSTAQLLHLRRGRDQLAEPKPHSHRSGHLAQQILECCNSISELFHRVCVGVMRITQLSHP